MSSDKVEIVLGAESKWMDNKFFEEQLQIYYKNNKVHVINFSKESATGKCENFSSDIYRVNVSFSGSSEKRSSSGSEDRDISHISLIVKQAASDEWSLSAYEKFDFFNKEVEFYTDVAPKINQKLSDLGESELFAELIGVCKSKSIMILEDLAAKGYRVLPAKEGFNFEETKAILKRIAIFHAACAVLQEENPDIFANFKYGHLSREIDTFKDYYALTLDVVIETISGFGPDFAVYVEKLRRLRGEILERARKTYDFNPDHFNTLNHDDVWSTNFMIKTSDGSPEKPFENIKLIDFQFAFCASPTIDLYYFLNSSVSHTCRPDRFDELVKFYYAQLIYFLKKMNYKKQIPTWPQFQAQYHERRIFGFTMGCLIQPFMTNSKVEMSVEDSVKDNANSLKGRRAIFKSDNACKTLRKLIPYYDQLGTFD
ncbi:uncharacterized protein LOC129568210 [Sitodiplosis mosellana]|uniref:uncharacterized protein LOC129568210 n=1 Tax=Sitodiplosis mosellana TaxID=263140 RepID=UPI0024439398|nr:uncharacterized protein LOC129568210 [Sitodiplosis mosellana]